MTSQEKVSFIIPTLNEEGRISLCLEAIKSQLRDGDEIIVVDNGNTDNTNEIAKSLGCKIVFEKEKGLSVARNAGAKMAFGDILCFIDADGQISPDWLNQALRSLSDEQVVAVSGLNIFSHKKPLKKFWYNTYTAGAYTFVLSFHSLFSWTFLVGNNMAIKKQVFDSLGGFEPVVGEDFWLSHNFGKEKSYKGAVNLKMKVRLSSRRFEQKGFLKTVFLDWIVDALTKTPQVKYAQLEKQIDS